MTIGFNKCLEEGIKSSWEFFALGSILFIPGSYHVFVAVMACKRVPGYDYDQVSVFEGEDFNSHDDWLQIQFINEI